MTGLHQYPFMADRDILRHLSLLTATTLILRHTQSVMSLDHGRQEAALAQG